MPNAVSLAVAAVAVLLGAETARAADAPRVVRERIEWLDVWLPGNDTPDRPRVLLVGDSIVKGYFKAVEERLSGKAVVCRLATSKSLGDPGLLDEVRLVLAQGRFSVVHVNNGLHGWGYTEAEYAAALPELFAAVRRGAPGAKVVWTTTTPVRAADKPSEFDPRTERVRARNELAAAAAAKEGVPVNDLFGAVVDRPELYSRDGVHFGPQGQAVIGERVAAELLKHLPDGR